ncbi:MAG TPA: ABC transporter substrate-binding protein [Burkholderiaceae bacterium]|nr:ABC transporter substrate-binding protein [Burkholderiaceae bacterium]
MSFEGVLTFRRSLFALARRLRGACVVGLTLAGGTVACMAQDLTIAVSRSSLSLPLFVADAQKYYAAEGVAVATRECLGGHRCIKLIFDGEVDLATASEMPTMLNSLQRSDFAIVATFATSKRDVKLVARKSAGITKPSDLRGKRIGTIKETSSHYFLDLFLLFNNVDPKEIQLVGLTPEQIPIAIAERTVDAVATFEPFAYRSMRALADDAVVMPSARIYTETFNLLAGRKVIAAREAAIVKVLRALARAQQFIRERPQQARAILEERMREGQGFVDATWGDFDYRLSLEQPLVSTLEGQARWAVRERHVARDSRIPNFLDFVALEPLRKADPAAVTLVK